MKRMVPAIIGLGLLACGPLSCGPLSEAAKTLTMRRSATAGEPLSGAALQKLIDATPDYGEITVRTVVELSRPLNLRGREGLRLRCVGAGELVANFRGDAARSWMVVDTTGSRGWVFDGLRIRVAKGSTPPACGVFFGRDPDKFPLGSPQHKMVNCHIRGAFGVACVYNVGSELLRVVDTRLWASGPAAAYMTCSWNAKGVQSPFGGIAGGPTIGGGGALCNSVQWFERCHFGADGTSPAMVFLPKGGGYNINNCSFSVKGTGPCAIYFGHETGYGEQPVPMLSAGTMTGNHVEYHKNWAAADVVIATTFADYSGGGCPVPPAGYRDIMENNPRFSRGVRFVNPLTKFPHPLGARGN